MAFTETIDVEKLRQIQQALVRAPELEPHGGVTFCNIGAQRIANAFGCKDLDNKLADEDYALLEKSQDWLETDDQGAHAAAIRGHLVVATFYRQSPLHGHITTIYPAPAMVPNSVWGYPVPWVANVGTLNEIGACDKHFPHGKPRYFVWYPEPE